MRRPTRDQTMLRMATVIGERSTCVRRKVGCVLTDVHGRIIATGHNGVPRGMQHCTDTPCGGANHPSGQGLNDCLSVHAEQNAMIFCNDIMDIDTCYVTTAPCETCIKMLLNTGCRRIVFVLHYAHPISQQLWVTDGRTWQQHTGDF